MSWAGAPRLQGEGHLRRAGWSPHGPPALAREPRPRPRPCSFGKNSDPSGAGSEAPTQAPATTPGPSPHSGSVLRRKGLARLSLPPPTPPQASTVAQPSSGWRDSPHSSPVPPLPAPGRPPHLPSTPGSLSQPGKRGSGGRRGEAQLPGFAAGLGQRIWPFGDLFGVFSHHVVLAEEE